MTCKKCKEKIDNKAKICPHCLSFQKWYGAIWFRLPIAVLMILVLYKITGISSILLPKKYRDYKNSFSVDFISASTGKKKNIRTYNITNTTDENWKNIVYQLLGYDAENKLVIAISQSNYSWFVRANANAFFSVEFDKHKEVKEWKFLIKKISVKFY